jgi:peptidoglycan/xylan/chitin deacetylase (PgdA/CDA1 family)
VKRRTHRQKKFFAVLLLVAFFCLPLGLDTTSAVGAEPAFASKVPVLCYHHLVDDVGHRWEHNNSVVTIAEFATQMAYLEREGYYPLTIDEFSGFLGGKKKLPAKSVLITFDDGYASNYWYAYPILARHKMKAVIFVLGSRIRPDAAPVVASLATEQDANGSAATEAQVALVDETATLEPDFSGPFAGLLPPPGYDNLVLDFMTWGQLDELAKSGLITLADHTWAAHSQRDGYLSAYEKMSKAGIVADRQLLRDEFQRRHIPLANAFAYPHGYHAKAARESVAASGVRLAFTLKRACAAPGTDPLRVPRLVVSPGLNEESFAQLLQGF